MKITPERNLVAKDWIKYTPVDNTESTRLQSRHFAAKKIVGTNCVERLQPRKSYMFNGDPNSI